MQAIKNAVAILRSIKGTPAEIGRAWIVADELDALASVPRQEPIKALRKLMYHAYNDGIEWKYCPSASTEECLQRVAALYDAPVSAEPIYQVWDGAAWCDASKEWYNYVSQDNRRIRYESNVSAEPDARLLDAMQIAADQIKKADYTPARSTLLCAIAAAEQAKPAPEYCDWKPGPITESWDGSCGAKWTINEGTPGQNGMKFCPECGKPLRELRGEWK